MLGGRLGRHSTGSRRRRKRRAAQSVGWAGSIAPRYFGLKSPCRRRLAGVKALHIDAVPLESLAVNATEFRAIVSGQRRGFLAAAWRAGLWMVEGPYRVAVRLRNWQFDSGRRAIERVSVPVVSIGNLTLGGTGKTPMVEWLAHWFRRNQARVTIISRGYGAEAGASNDEALELEQKLPDVPHVQNPDRVAAARMAIEEFECQVILLDDAFQHRRIHRDLDIVLLDSLEPFGFDHVFPRGMLREPVASLGRADVVALSRRDVLQDHERLRIEAIVAQLNPKCVWVECEHRPRELLSASGATKPLASLAGRPIAAFCGVGNPAGFRHTLDRCGCHTVDFREFPDHFAYGRDDVQSLSEWAAELPVDAVLCTHKDLVKLGVDRLGGKPLWAVAIGLEIVVGQDAFERRLWKVLEKIESQG